MSFSDKEKRRLIAITRQLKEQKGITINPKNINADIKNFKADFQELDNLKQEYGDLPAIVEEAEAEQKKLKSIINDLNDYMAVLHPEGLLDMSGGSSSGGSFGAA